MNVSYQFDSNTNSLTSLALALYWAIIWEHHINIEKTVATDTDDDNVDADEEGLL